MKKAILILPLALTACMTASGTQDAIIKACKGLVATHASYTTLVEGGTLKPSRQVDAIWPAAEDFCASPPTNVYEALPRIAAWTVVVSQALRHP